MIDMKARERRLDGFGAAGVAAISSLATAARRELWVDRVDLMVAPMGKGRTLLCDLHASRNPYRPDNQRYPSKVGSEVLQVPWGLAHLDITEETTYRDEFNSADGDDDDSVYLLAAAHRIAVMCEHIWDGFVFEDGWIGAPFESIAKVQIEWVGPDEYDGWPDGASLLSNRKVPIATALVQSFDALEEWRLDHPMRLTDIRGERAWQWRAGEVHRLFVAAGGHYNLGDAREKVWALGFGDREECRKGQINTRAQRARDAFELIDSTDGPG